MKDYHINIFFSEEDSGYIADIPDLPHCSAFGETPEKALAEVLRAKAAWMEAAKAEGKPVPPPAFKPVIYQVSNRAPRPPPNPPLQPQNGVRLRCPYFLQHKMGTA